MIGTADAAVNSDFPRSSDAQRPMGVRLQGRRP